MLDVLLDRIAVQLEEWGVEVVRGVSNPPGTIVVYDAQKYLGLFGNVDVAMFSSRNACPRSLLEQAPWLRGVVNPSIGVETIDVEAANECGILVANGAVAENYVGMAEAAVMLLLNLQYGLRSTEEVFMGTRPRPSLEKLHAKTLRGSTVGIVGFGNIGRTITTLLEPFGVTVVVHSPHADPLKLPGAVRLVDLETLMAESDIVCLCLAVTAHNRGLISARMLGLMKRSAYIVNIARGSAVDETALTDVLARGSIAGAALDTFVVEPLSQGSPLREMRNVILTPHMVGQTVQAYEASFDAALENICRLLNGEVPAYCKNPSAVDSWRRRIARQGNRYEIPEKLGIARHNADPLPS